MKSTARSASSDPQDPFHATLANLLESKQTELLQQRRLAIETVHETISLPLLGAMTAWLGGVRRVRPDRPAQRGRLHDDHPLRPVPRPAIFFILDFDKPLTGIIRASSEPAREAFRHLDKP